MRGSAGLLLLCTCTASSRAPAVPLWVHSPYVNWWSPADNATDSWVTHVRNDKVGSMTCALRIDGTAYSLLGPLHSQCPPGSPLAMPALPQVGAATVRPTQTIYSFRGAGVAAKLSFSSPKFLADMDSYAPIALIHLSTRSVDGRVHRVQAFFEMTGQMVVDADSAPVGWARDPWRHTSMRIFHAGGVPLREYSPFSPASARGGQPVEHIDWGTAHLSVPAGERGVGSWMGSSNTARSSFAETGALPGQDETAMPLPACKDSVCKCEPGGVGNDWPSLSVSWDLGNSTAGQARAALSHDDQGASARYFGVVMAEYWRRSSEFSEVVERVLTDFDSLRAKCEAYDDHMMQAMAAAGGPDFAIIGALSYRQVLADNSLVYFTGQGLAQPAPAGPMLFVKGLGSSGDTGTIDDNYPAALLFLWGQPELLNALLRPINIFMQNKTVVPNGSWPLNVSWGELYSIHYLGQYPVAELQCWGNHYDHSAPCEGMPLEITADNLQMMAAAALATNDYSDVEEFFSLLRQYADYLVDHGLRPALQPCSDDYEGPSALNANLAAKSIIGIAAFSALCNNTGRDCGGRYWQIAADYAREWTALAAGGRGGATVRTYGLGESWSQKYNLIWDQVFGFGLFDKAIEAECAFYMAHNGTVRREYGWYLDSRSEADARHLTNAGWSEWTAAMCGASAVRDLYSRIRRFAEETPDRWALTDFYNADSGRRMGFEGRAQMGGFGASLVLQKYPGGLLRHRNR